MGNFYNPKKAEEEKIIKEKSQIKNEQRIKYLNNLWANRHFQEFVIKEIIEAEIEENRTYTPSIESLIKIDPITHQRTMLVASGGVKAAQNIKNKIQNPR